MRLRTIYALVGTLAGLVFGILGAIIAGFLYVIFFGLLFAGDKTVEIAGIGFYVVITLTYLSLVILGGMFGFRYGRNRENLEEQDQAMRRGKMLLIVLSVLIIVLIAFGIYYESLPSVEADVDIATLVGGLVPGTYRVYASVQELNLTCFCPIDVQCKSCNGGSYALLQDKTGSVKTHLSLDSSKNIETIKDSNIFVIEKEEDDENQYFYLKDYH